MRPGFSLAGKATRKKPPRPETSPLREIYRDWEWRIRRELLEHWREKLRKLTAQLDKIKAVTDLNSDKDWWAEWEQLYFALLLPYIDEATAIGAAAGAELLEVTWALGVDADTYNVAAADWARKYAGKLAKGLTKTDKKMVRHHLSSWIEASEDFPDLVKRLDSFLLNTSRAEMIAATEATQAYAEGNLAVWRTSDVITGVSWNTARDEKVCMLCGPLDGQVTKVDGDVWQNLSNPARSVGQSVPAPPAHPNCYADGTEILTIHNGWQPLKNMQIGDLVWTLDPISRDMEIGRVVNTVAYPVEKAIYIRNSQRSLETLVSLNHRFFGYKRNWPDRELVVSRPMAGGLNSEFKFYISSEWTGLEADVVSVVGRQWDTEQFCKFMGYWLAEGSATRRKGRSYMITIAQAKEKPREIMLADLDGMPFVNNVWQTDGKIGINDFELGRYLDQFGYSHQKFVPDCIKELSPKYLRVFLDAFRLGDGSIKKGKYWKGGQFSDSTTYCTSSNQMASDLGEILIKAGKAVSYHLQEVAGTEQEFKNGTYTINHDCWIVNELNSNYRLIENAEAEIIPYHGIVYDVEVDRHHTILVRYKGRVRWGSNCRCWLSPFVGEL